MFLKKHTKMKKKVTKRKNKNKQKMKKIKKSFFKKTQKNEILQKCNIFVIFLLKALRINAKAFFT